MQIPAVAYTFSPADIEFLTGAYQDLLASGQFLTMGRHCEEFERAFAEYVGTRHAISVNSGTAALETILRSLDVRNTDVIVPTNTFAATVYAVLAAGGRPVFADIGDDLIVDPDDVARRITPNTKVVITVHIGGVISESTAALQALCNSRGLMLVEDAAHAHGSRLEQTFAGCFGKAAAFSFFSTKVITTGEGGMVVTDDDEVAERIRLLRDQGKVKGKNYHEGFGYNWRMTEFQALMGIVQLRHIEEFIAERNRVARGYTNLLDGKAGLSLLQHSAELRQNYYKYTLFLDPGISRETVQTQLKREFGVSPAGLVYDLPCHLQPAFAEFNQGALPRAEDLCSRHFCLPVFPQMTDEQLGYTAQSLLACLQA